MEEKQDGQNMPLQMPHVSVRIEIEPEDLALRIDAGYPSKSGTRKIDGREIAPVQQKT